VIEESAAFQRDHQNLIISRERFGGFKRFLIERAIENSKEKIEGQNRKPEKIFVL